MVNRIKALADNFNLSPTAFADRIEVARPVISHIFSERNRPSLEVIQKIGLAFPDVSFEWLLYGKGEMLKSLGSNTQNIPSENAIDSEGKVKALPITDRELDSLNANQEAQATALVDHFSSNKKIVKVLFFYQDNTFEEFNLGK